MAGGTVVGLDIGSNLIKVVEMKKTGSGVEVTALDLAPTPHEAIENGVILDAQLLGKTIKELLSKARITAKKVVSSVSGQGAVVRVIEVPQMKPAELEETMKWEVERQVPFNAAESIVDFKPIQRPEGYAEGQNMDVLLAVAQQDLVDRHVEALFAAGLKPSAIDVEPLAEGRALLELLPDYGAMPGHTVAIVNIGANNTDVSIFRDKLLAFPRTLPLAGENFTRAIADALQVDMASAESYKREYAEVIFNQMQQTTPFAGTGDNFGGFMDFGAMPVDPAGATEEPPVTATQAVPQGSGKMPFDFSTPGDDAPLPGPSASPFDLSGDVVPEENAAPFMTQAAPVEEPNFFQPVQPDFASTPQPDFGANPGNLPAVTAGDPAREAMRVQVFNAIAPILAEMVQEVRRSIDFYRGRAIDPTIHEILLTGGTAKLPNLAAFMEQELGIPCRVADPLRSVQVSTKNYSPGHLEEIATLFPVCIGLGARDMISAPAGGKKRK